MEKQRLDKLLASTGKWSRREIRLLVRAGRVLVDGIPAASAEEKYDPSAVGLSVDGEPAAYCRTTWLMMNKPGGVLSATEDGRGSTVLDLLPPQYSRMGLFPVGRLDRDTEGLLLLTNDGKAAHRLLSPRHHVSKVYYVRVRGCLTEEDCAAFQRGMLLGDGLQCMPAELKIQCTAAESEAYVTLWEGKFHQIKRMLAACGKPVVYLRRVQMGNLTLDPALGAGKYRCLSIQEVQKLLDSEDLVASVQNIDKF